METRNVIVLKKYKSVRNAVKRDVQKIIKLEQHEIASQCKNNPKKFWSYINNKPRGKSFIGELKGTDNQGISYYR